MVLLVLLAFTDFDFKKLNIKNFSFTVMRIYIVYIMIIWFK